MSFKLIVEESRKSLQVGKNATDELKLGFKVKESQRTRATIYFN